MYKIAVIGDYDSIYGFATLGLSICPVKNREETKEKLNQLASGKYGIIYITEAAAAGLKEEIEKYQEQVMPAIIQIPENRRSDRTFCSVTSKLGRIE